MDIPIDARVECADGHGGRSTHVIVDPRRRRVTHLVVEERSWLHIARLVPLDLVTRTDAHTIWLRCTRAELAALDDFIEADVVPPWEDPDEYADALEYPPDRLFLWPYQPAVDLIPPPFIVQSEHIPPGERDISRGARVIATDGPVGRVDEFVIDPADGAISHLVLREGHFWDQKDVTIPLAEIDRLADDAVYLKLDKAAIGALPAVPAHRH